MPHFSYEYSANLEDKVNLKGLCDVTLNSAMETGEFPLGGTRVRMLKCDHYAIADKHPENAFIHLTVSIGVGRSKDVRKAVGEHIWANLTKYLAAQFSQPYFALSMEIRELSDGLSWKENSIHPRIKASQ